MAKLRLEVGVNGVESTITNERMLLIIPLLYQRFNRSPVEGATLVQQAQWVCDALLAYMRRQALEQHVSNQQEAARIAAEVIDV